MASQLSKAIENFDLVGWADQHIRLYNLDGKYVRGDCPICGGRKKLTVIPQQHRVMCFKCLEGGMGGTEWDGRASAFEFVQMVLGCGKKEAAEIIIQNSGVTFSYNELDEKPKSYSLPKGALDIDTACDIDHPCRVYLCSRGLDHMRYKWKVCVTGRYAGRIIMPVVYIGEHFGFDAKSYVGSNLKSLSDLLKPDAVYMASNFSKDYDFAVVTESIFDAESVMQGIGLFGSGLNEGRFVNLLKLKSVGINTLYWMFDSDAKRKQFNIARRWTSLCFRNMFCMLPSGDPNSLGPQVCFDYIKNAVDFQTAMSLRCDTMEDFVRNNP